MSSECVNMYEKVFVALYALFMGSVLMGSEQRMEKEI